MRGISFLSFDIAKIEGSHESAHWCFFQKCAMFSAKCKVGLLWCVFQSKMNEIRLNSHDTGAFSRIFHSCFSSKTDSFLLNYICFFCLDSMRI